jgi:hypothetical protein
LTLFELSRKFTGKLATFTPADYFSKVRLNPRNFLGVPTAYPVLKPHPLIGAAINFLMIFFIELLAGSILLSGRGLLEFAVTIGCAMTLKIFVDDKGFYCLKRSIPVGSPSKFIVEQSVHLNFFGSNTVISCDETEARNLLLYAAHCPTVISAIHRALVSAGIPIYP